MPTLSCKGRLLDLSSPKIMGILNITSDSFYDGGRYTKSDAWIQQAAKMLEEGADILDVGGASSRPGAVEVPEEEERNKVTVVIEDILKRFPEALISVDTWRASVARAAVETGAAIVNDISAGRLDPSMYDTVAALDVPYILMHMKGTPADMQKNPVYENVVTEVLDFLIAEVQKLRSLGIQDIILDPGFGFGKTIAHNYTLLKNLHVFGKATGLPVLAGLSRKSMTYKFLGISPDQALNGTTALNMVALQQGACILRVHDVREAVQTMRLFEVMSF
ncbi:MAG: dihydropteroate synthase [Bacteroidetes bacterium]|nr:dihydropteroate synthase [Bacteroidota bacterium]